MDSAVVAFFDMCGLALEIVIVHNIYVDFGVNVVVMLLVLELVPLGVGMESSFGVALCLLVCVMKKEQSKLLLSSLSSLLSLSRL